jgi:hypothetical protein
VVNHDADKEAGYQLDSREVGSVAIEEVLCRPAPVGNLETLVPRTSTAWSMTLPGLAGLPRFEGTPRRLRICIATEDIVGPVRNGGIGTTATRGSGSFRCRTMPTPTGTRRAAIDGYMHRTI